MSEDALLDNDLTFKVAAYVLAQEVLTLIAEFGYATAVLGVSRFVISKVLAKTNRIGNKSTTAQELQRLWAAVAFVEPTEQEGELAARLEEAAQRLNVPLDTGESQLLALLVTRDAKLMLTGDKRAIRAIEVVVHDQQLGDKSAGRIACLEQLTLGLLIRHGPNKLRESVCNEASVDKALAICFSCNSDGFTLENAIVGLASYIGDVRGRARTVLARAVAL